MSRVSIIMPVYNREAWLPATLDSLIRQRYPHWNVVVCDDGSTDSSVEILRRYAQIDNRIRWFRRESPLRGGSVCRNLALQHADGEYVLFLDSDDILPEVCLQERVAVMDKNQGLDAGIFGCATFSTTPDQAVPYHGVDRYDSEALNFLYNPVPWITSSPLWHRRALGAKPFHETLCCNQDWEMHVRLLLDGIKIKRFTNQAPYLQRRGHDTISSRLHSNPFMCSFVDAALQVCGHPAITAQSAHFRRRLWARVRFGLLRLLKHGYYEDAASRAVWLAQMPVARGWRTIELRALRTFLSCASRMKMCCRS